MADETSEESVGEMVVRLKGDAGSLYTLMDDAIDHAQKLVQIGKQMEAAITAPIQAAAAAMGPGGLAGTTSQAVQQTVALTASVHSASSALSQLDNQRAAAYAKRAHEVDTNWEQAAFAMFLKEEREAAVKDEEIRREQLRKQKEIDTLSRAQTEQALANWRSYKESLKEVQDEIAFEQFQFQEHLQEQVKEKQATYDRKGGDDEGGGGGGHGGINHYMVRRLGYHAGLALGMSGVGNDITGALVAFEAFGPVIGTITVAAAALATVMSKISEESKKSYASLLDYSTELTKTSGSFRSQAIGQLPGNDVSRFAFGASKESLDSMNQSIADNGKVVAEAGDRMFRWLPTFREFTDRVERGWQRSFRTSANPDETSWDRQQALANRRIETSRRDAEVFDALGKRYEQIQINRNVVDRYMALEAARTATMYEGPVKKRLQLEEDIEASRKRIARTGEDRLAVAQAAGQSAWEKANDAVKEAGAAITQGGKPGAVALQRWQDAVDARDRVANENRTNEGSIQNENRLDLKGQDAQAGQRRIAFVREQEEQITEIGYRYTEARIQATTTGYARQLALLRAKNAQEHDISVAHGINTIATDAIASQAELALQNDHAHTLAETRAGMEDRWLVATHQIVASTAQWRAQERNLTYELSATTEEITRMHAAWKMMNEATINGKILDDMRGLAIEFDHVTHKLTDLQAAYAKNRLPGVEGNVNLLDKQAQLQQKITSAQFAHRELSELHPLLKLQDYLRDIEAAKQAGVLGKSDAEDLIKKKTFDLFGHMDAGTFNSEYVKGQVDVNKVNLNSQFSREDILHNIGTTLESINGFVQGWKALQ